LFAEDQRWQYAMDVPEKSRYKCAGITGTCMLLRGLRYKFRARIHRFILFFI